MNDVGRLASGRAMRSRATSLAAAFVLAMLLAAAGVPAAVWSGQTGTHASQVDGAAERIAVVGAPALAAAPAPARRALLHASPRPAPRVRRIQDGGLPPPRAP